MRFSVALFFSVLLVISNQHNIFAEDSQTTEDIRYISDFLVINIKDRLERPFTVVGIVKSGDPVKILEENETYFKVETAAGKTGWISKQYVKSETPKPIIIKQLEREIDGLKSQLLTVQSEAGHVPADNQEECNAALNDLEQKLRDAEATIAQLEQERERLAQESTPVDQQSEEWIKLHNDNNALNKDLAKTREEYGQLVAEFDKRGKTIAELQNTLAKQENKTKFLWFGAGALVFLVGMFAGKAGSKKKSKFTY